MEGDCFNEGLENSFFPRMLLSLSLPSLLCYVPFVLARRPIWFDMWRQKRKKKSNNVKAFNIYPLPILSPFYSFPFNPFLPYFSFFLLHVALSDVSHSFVKEWRHTYWDSANDLFGQSYFPIIRRVWLDFGRASSRLLDFFQTWLGPFFAWPFHQTFPTRYDNDLM